jgi:hypothetical protein
MKHFGITPFISAHATDPSSVLLLLRGSPANMRKFAYVQHLLLQLPPTYVENNANLNGLDHLIAFLTLNEPLLPDTPFHCGIEGFTTPIHYIRSLLTTGVGSRRMVITDLPPYVWPRSNVVPTLRSENTVRSFKLTLN